MSHNSLSRHCVLTLLVHGVYSMASIMFLWDSCEYEQVYFCVHLVSLGFFFDFFSYLFDLPYTGLFSFHLILFLLLDAHLFAK